MIFRCLFLSATFAVSAAMLHAAQDAPNATDASEPQNDSKDTPRVKNVQPLVKWTFDAEEPGVW